MCRGKDEAQHEACACCLGIKEKQNAGCHENPAGSEALCPNRGPRASVQMLQTLSFGRVKSRAVVAVVGEHMRVPMVAVIMRCAQLCL